MRKLLLISDLDNTWVGDQKALEALQQYLGDRGGMLFGLCHGAFLQFR
ncbi:HAD family hydrolase [Synechocystis salina]|nr:HAD family hydrolase [Synechocystis salina]